ncbi:15 kDa selenoprotein [Pteropus alecto]|uniref:Selenoprotein F n=1 Tax=Pteropus alecto TaxID=9402 RepID=L5K432_PTEAL|nr:15 kDa selenoprotein [Pteropus alecto]
MAAGPGGWLGPAFGLRLLMASILHVYVRGSDPVLKLLDDNGNIAEELSILKWNTDSVEEFLNEKLERM